MSAKFESSLLRSCVQPAQRLLVEKAIILHPKFIPSASKLSGEDVTTHWDSLPFEILHRVATFIPEAKDLITFGRLCKASRMAADDDLLWKELACRDFNTPRDVKPSSWKELYRYNHRILYEVLVFRGAQKLVELGNGVFLTNYGVVVA